MYPQRLLEYFRDARHTGVLPPPAIVVQVENPACGDILKLSARIAGGHVEEAAFQTRGCTASIAAGSALAGWLAGKPRRDVEAFEENTIDELLGGLPAASKHAASLCASGVKELLMHWPE
jgi:nitrogen fixation NifU-like protein